MQPWWVPLSAPHVAPRRGCAAAAHGARELLAPGAPGHVWLSLGSWTPLPGMARGAGLEEAAVVTRSSLPAQLCQWSQGGVAACAARCGVLGALRLGRIFPSEEGAL